MKKLFIITALICSILTGCGAVGINKLSSPETYSSIMPQGEKEEAEAKDITFECTSNDKIIRGAIRMPDNYDKGSDLKYPAAILSHGILSDRNQGGLFTKLADSLASKGIVSVRFDFDGYGESEGSLADNSIKTECEDLKSVINYVNSLEYININKVSLVGYSMGGAAASVVAGQIPDEVHSLVLWAPAAVLRDECKRGMMLGTAVDIDNLPDKISVMNEEYTFGKKFFEDAVELDIYGESEMYTGPVLILHGEEDIVVPMIYSEKYNNIYDNSKLIVIERANHIFTEKELDKVISLTTDFLD